MKICTGCIAASALATWTAHSCNELAASLITASNSSKHFFYSSWPYLMGSIFMPQMTPGILYFLSLLKRFVAKMMELL